MSLARRFVAAPQDTMVPKPTKPTRAMAKPSSIPVMKRRMSAARPTMPIATSLIVAPEDLHDVRDHHHALDEAAHPHADDDGIEGHAQRGGHLPCRAEGH